MKIKAHLKRLEPGRSRRNGVMTGEVARAVRQAIFEGEYRPGDPLPELHLARKFGVSQAVVREALASLAHAGLVRRFPNKGTFVTSLTPTEIGELVRIRLLLESTAWIEAATRATRTGLESLTRKLDLMALAVEAKDYDGVAQADLEFHREIWRMTQDETLSRLLDQVTVPLLAFVSVRRNQRRDDLSVIVGEHSHIIDVLRRGDRDEIVRECRLATERSYMGFLTPSLAGAAGLAITLSAPTGAQC
jgi:DNA-binding GntR family transcriptional regulator